jgi:integral membrane protein
MLNLLKRVAILEGISYLLFAITMPLKRYYGMLLPNKIVGMSHGILFISYILLVLFLSAKKNWTIQEKILLYLASVLPFGTFYVEKKILNRTN